MKTKGGTTKRDGSLERRYAEEEEEEEEEASQIIYCTLPKTISSLFSKSRESN